MKKYFTLIILALLPVLANAYDAEIDGIYYNFYGNEAGVTCLYYNSNRNSEVYLGIVNIPSSVTDTIYNTDSVRILVLHQD